MTAQCLKKWLKTAADQAPQDGAVGLDLADTGCPLDLPGGRGAVREVCDYLMALRARARRASRARTPSRGRSRSTAGRAR